MWLCSMYGHQSMPWGVRFISSPKHDSANITSLWNICFRNKNFRLVFLPTGEARTPFPARAIYFPPCKVNILTFIFIVVHPTLYQRISSATYPVKFYISFFIFFYNILSYLIVIIYKLSIKKSRPCLTSIITWDGVGLASDKINNVINLEVYLYFLYILC